MFLTWANKRGCQYQRQKDKTEREREDVKKCIFFKVCWGCFINIKAEDWELPTTCRCFSEWSEWNFLREKSNNSHSRILYSVHFQFSSVQSLSCLILCDPMDHSMPDLPVHHHCLEFTQTHVHWVGDAIQPSHPLLSPSLPAPSPSQHQDLFQWVSSSHQLGKVLELQLQHQSFQWTPRTDLL